VDDTPIQCTGVSRRSSVVSKSKTKVPRLRAPFPAHCVRSRSRFARDDNF